jgi:hypothetical protein
MNRSSFLTLAASVLLIEAGVYLWQGRTLDTLRVAASEMQVEERFREQISRIPADRGAPPESPVPTQAVPVEPVVAYARALVQEIERAKDHFRLSPRDRIPEIDFLTEANYRLILKPGTMADEAERRDALAALRTRGKLQVQESLKKAVRDYLAAHEGRLPANFAEVAPFLPASFPTEVLGAYRIGAPGPEAKVPASATWLVEEIRPPVDPEYDTKVTFGAGFGSNAQLSPTYLAFTKAQRDYATAIGYTGVSAESLDELRPYLPVDGLDEAHLRLLFDRARDRFMPRERE